MRWVAVLLIVAVVLPTVCLLWFMSQAIRNERLAVRQKLVDTYTKRAETFFIKHPNLLAEMLATKIEPYGKDFEQYQHIAITGNSKYFPAHLVYGKNGEILWPVMEGSEAMELDMEVFGEAYEWEFEKGNILKAIEAYTKIAEDTDDKLLKFTAEMAIVRCLNKSGQIPKAIELCYKLAYTKNVEIDGLGPTEKSSQAKVLLAELMYKSNDERLATELTNSLTHIYFYAGEGNTTVPYPSEIRVWAVEKTIDIAKQAKIESIGSLIQKAEEEVSQEKNSLIAAESLKDKDIFESWPEGTIKTLDTADRSYGIYYAFGDKRVVGLLNNDKIIDFFGLAAEEYEEYGTVFCRVLDDTGKLVAGRQWDYAGDVITTGEMFLSLEPGEYFKDWKVELYFRDGVFGNAAKRTKLAYGWTAALVIGFMVLICGFTVKSLMHQARVNRLKNDFVATVSHELKTPLASMRVLVDTVLEGNYKDETQVREYLELVAKENKRLTGLIDNFLTFSRMERNKQAFSIVPTSAKQIADDAADAVGTRLEQSGCKLKITIDEQLPSIDADHDAMVTVLVNLLDNAWKYSGDDKKIELSVFSKDGCVCFTVKDNGVGMNKRTAKKIFDRFYQADSSLARKAEGCGLGLSIVKFIVDAHNGSVNIESKPQQGSIFTVILPTDNQ